MANMAGERSYLKKLKPLTYTLRLLWRLSVVIATDVVAVNDAAIDPVASFLSLFSLKPKSSSSSSY